MKILEAMAARVPVLSTPLGAEGLAICPGRDILLIDQDDGWRAAIEELASDRARWTAFASAGREMVCAHYDWEVIRRSLRSIYVSWLNNGSV